MDLEEFVQSHSRELLRHAYLLSGDHGLAEDLVQSVMVRAWGRWSRITVMDHPTAYLKRMVVNAYLDTRRRRSAHETSFDPASPPRGGMPTVADVAEGVAVRDEMWRALAGLPKQQRAVVVLR